MPLPELQDATQGQPTAVEALPVPTGEAITSAAYSALERTFGASLETRLIGKFAGGKQYVPYADAKRIMEEQGYDAAVLPQGGLSNTELNAIMNQQGTIRRNEAIVEQSKLSPWLAGAAHIAGSAGDPLFIAAGPVVGRLGLAAKGMGLGGRLATGAAEGAGTMAGYDVLMQHYGTAPGDRDIDTKRIVMDSLTGGLIGGVLHGVLGPRKAPTPDIGGYMDMIRQAENTAAYAKQHGIPENEVVSKAGAVGTYQVMPSTAKQYGFNPDMLKDPAYNRQVSEAIVTDLRKKFGDDPDAIAVGYNAGPGVAKKFVESGHDLSVLPKETRAYLDRINRIGARPSFGLRESVPDRTPEVTAAANDAILAAAHDAETRFAPIVSEREPFEIGEPQPWATGEPYRVTAMKVRDEHEAEVQSIASEAMRRFSARQPLEANSALSKPVSGAESPVATNAERPPTPAMEAAELDRHATEAVAEAKQIGVPEQAEGAEHPLDAVLADSEESLHKDGYSEDMVKAVHAAIRCGLGKGLD